ncbi:histone-lysine N-methyltransferase SETDB1-B-like isoform X1 [Embiotoca jacksoni]|uniref:histone-lysine N-methyltransferase SETDB1-B-like isoform X1 n=1 Tax=Embiotoca jacksoni TaxID=100190 RepID=UPI0037040B6B
MEEDEMEMSKEEFQRWIQHEVKRGTLFSPDVPEKCTVLQSLLEKIEEQTADLLRLCKSVAACEEIVRKQYSLLGWTYSDTDSDDDDNPRVCGKRQTILSESDECKSSACSSATSTGPAPLLPKPQVNENQEKVNGTKRRLPLMRELVVVLTKLPLSTINKYSASSPPQNDCIGDESLSTTGSVIRWEPDDSIDDSDISLSSFNSGSNKRRKISQKSETSHTRHGTMQASRNSDAKSKRAKTSVPTASTNSCAKSNKTKASTSRVAAKTNAKSSTKNTEAPQANAKNNTIKASTSNKEGRAKTAPSVLPEEISVNMPVLARKGTIDWQQGTVVKIITKEDGKLKYKVKFEEKGKSLLSGHHIAFDCLAKVDQLIVGARVVVKCNADKQKFLPGVLAEVPSRKNHMRFLVFCDDLTPVYVPLPSLYLVCKPLPDPLDDIPEDYHRDFMMDYVRSWPNVPQTQYKVGQNINAQLNGFLQRCEVLEIDSSLMKINFLKDQREEWIYRGSLRLEQIINMRKVIAMKKEGNKKNMSVSVVESSKPLQ